MGYANIEQKGRGIHLRQFSRAFIIDDGVRPFVFVSVDCGMIGDGIRQSVSVNFLTDSFKWFSALKICGRIIIAPLFVIRTNEQINVRVGDEKILPAN